MALTTSCEVPDSIILLKGGGGVGLFHWVLEEVEKTSPLAGWRRGCGPLHYLPQNEKVFSEMTVDL